MSQAIDKMKMEVEAARFEVVQAEKEISTIRMALRNLVTASSSSATAAAVASSSDPQDAQPAAGSSGKEEDVNSLMLSATKITGLPEGAEPILRIQLSSPIEEQVITRLMDPLHDPSSSSSSSSSPTTTQQDDGSHVKFMGVDASVATIVIKAWDKDIPLGCSAVYDVGPLCEVDVLEGVLKKVTHLEVAIVPDEEGVGVQGVHQENDGENQSSLDKNVKDNEDDDVDGVEDGVEEEFQDAKSQLVSVQDETEKDDEDDDDNEDDEDDDDYKKEDNKDDDNKEGEQKEEEEDDDDQGNKDEVVDEAEPQNVLEISSKEKTTNLGEEEKESDSTSSAESTKAMAAPLLPICVVHLRVEYHASIKEQKDALYDLLNQASKKKAMAVDQLRKSATALNRANAADGTTTDGAGTGAGAKKQDGMIKSGFLKKNAGNGMVKKEFFLWRWYKNTLGPDSLVRRVFPVAKNYILFFGGVALMHFQGQQLALPPPV